MPIAPKIELYISKVLQLAWEKRFDVIHDYTGMLATANALAAPLPSGQFPPVIHTVHGSIEAWTDNYTELAKYPGFHLVAISNSQLKAASMRARRLSRVIYNCPPAFSELQNRHRGHR